MCPWYPSNPHAGGVKIPPAQYPRLISQANAYAATRQWKFPRELKLRFRGQFCYLEFEESDGRVSPAGRLRYLGDSWSAAIYTYGSVSYLPCSLSNKKESGTFKEALRVSELCL
jgi:hypothetical protein